MMSPPQPADVLRLGRVPYREAWDFQAVLQQRLVDAKRAGPPEPLPHTVLVVEHPPVFTLGKSGDPANLLASEDELAHLGAEYVPVDRGGDITFHGPGQVVVYPILDLDRLATPEGESLHDLHRYLRELEEAVIRTCADWGVEAGRVGGRTGVWVGPDGHGDERKVCAMGVRCSRWVTMHGLALNVTTDLGWFDRIVPCGIDDRGVTSLERESDRPAPFDAVADRLLVHLGERLGLAVTEHAGHAAWARLKEITRENLGAEAT
ncbi:lipoyl(octanoyl) transferase LipB [Rubrivirga marina]|uniref:Octanoyltransferase n=1 Tax=Rubrivirga marina TaxID=1196024 RepID=A0A271J4V6_9BACT|nr:lipoyl(octanoyl) transferase [Rubrivirga marina]